MHRHDGGNFFFRGNCGDGIGRKIEGALVNIRQHGRCARSQDGADASEKAEWCGDDLVIGADVQPGQPQPDGIRTAGAAERMGNAAGRGGGFLEALDCRAEDELLGVADFGERGQNFAANLGVLTAKVQHGNGLERGAGCRFERFRHLNSG